MQSNATLTVIITTYKRDFAGMLEDAIKSVLAQTYPIAELFVVSDNPPDSEYARKVAEGVSRYPQVTLIQLPRNSGAPVARNTGIMASTGEFIAFLDDDDLWMPQKAEKQMPLFDDPEVGLAYSRGYTFQGNDLNDHIDYANAHRGFNPHCTFNELLVHDYIGTTSQAIVRRECFANCGLFDVDLKARQDYDKWLSILLKYKAAGVDEPLFWLRKHQGDHITRSIDVALASNARVYRKYHEYYLKNRNAMRSFYHVRAHMYRKAGKPLRYVYFLCAAFCCTPLTVIKKALARGRKGKEGRK